MTSADAFKIRQVYQFDVYPVAILGSVFKNVTVLAIMDRETANREIDTQALHIQMFPYLPVGTPNDPAAYEYIKIRTQAGDTQIIGLAWVNPATVQLVQSVVVNVKVGNVAVADVPRIRNALVMNGFNAIEITVS